jgi:CRISPR/Cas system CMR-associated protein Cmr1 (group 7 of RAMP superfamily)
MPTAILNEAFKSMKKYASIAHNINLTISKNRGITTNNLVVNFYPKITNGSEARKVELIALKNQSPTAYQK